MLFCCPKHVHFRTLNHSFLGFPIAIPLRATHLELCEIMRICVQFLGVYRARNGAQVKSTCVGNPRYHSPFFIEILLHAKLKQIEVKNVFNHTSSYWRAIEQNKNVLNFKYIGSFCLCA